VFFTVGTFGRSLLGYAVPLHGQYTINVFFEKTPLGVRSELPLVGPLMLITFLVLVAALAMFILGRFGQDQKNSKRGWLLFRTAAVLQVVVVATLFLQVKTATNVAANIPEREYPAFSTWMAEQTKQPVAVDDARRWISDNSAKLSLNLNSNPVDFGALIGLMVALVCVSLFAWKRDDLMKALPDMPTIDSLLYRTVGVAFPLLSLLLITGAVWANESWGRYWGWDSKEVGALVAWMAYAGFLHTRIAHGWRGRRSAYFALLGFALVIFTWLGVSFLLPGLHSYAGV